MTLFRSLYLLDRAFDRQAIFFAWWSHLLNNECYQCLRASSARVQAHAHTALLYLRNGLTDCVQIWWVGCGLWAMNYVLSTSHGSGGVSLQVRTCTPRFCRYLKNGLADCVRIWCMGGACRLRSVTKSLSCCNSVTRHLRSVTKSLSCCNSATRHLRSVTKSLSCCNSGHQLRAFHKSCSAGEMIPEVEGTLGPPRKRVPECLEGPKTTHTTIAIFFWHIYSQNTHTTHAVMYWSKIMLHSTLQYITVEHYNYYNITLQLLQLLKNSPRKVKRVHFCDPPGSHPGNGINGARRGRSLPVPPPGFSSHEVMGGVHLHVRTPFPYLGNHTGRIMLKFGGWLRTQ